MIDLKGYTTFVFDFDGTLADTLPICFESFRRVFRKYNQEELADDEIEARFGPSETGVIQNYVKPREKADEALRLFYTIYQQEHDRLARTQDDVVQLLAQLKESGKNIAVVTGKGRKSYDFSVDKLSLTPYIDLSIAGDEVNDHKPHGEGIVRVLEYFDCPPEQAVYFGDSNADILAADHAGIVSVGVNWFDERSFDVQPDYMSQTPKDILI